jgi:uridine kinase
VKQQTYLDVDALAAAVHARGSQSPTILAGIDGAGASGKSTLASLLAERLGATVVHVDDFYLPSAVRDSRAGEIGALFDLPRLAEQVVRPAAAGLAVRYQRYDWDTDRLAEWIAVPARTPVVVEGVYTLQQQLRELYTYTVFCRALADVRLRRGLERDGEAARSMWVDEWMPAEDRYVETECPDEYANLVVDSSDGAEDGPARYTVVRWRNQ